MRRQLYLPACRVFKLSHGRPNGVLDRDRCALGSRLRFHRLDRLGYLCLLHSFCEPPVPLVIIPLHHGLHLERSSHRGSPPVVVTVSSLARTFCFLGRRPTLCGFPTEGSPGGSVYVDAYNFLCVDAIASSMGAMDGRGTRLSRVVIVLTLQTRKEEGHLAYRSQSDNPLQGTTLGGSTDDPGRQHTRTAAARHPAGARGGRERGLPRSGDLPHGVLPLAEAARALRARRPASAPPPRPAGPTSAAGAPGPAAGPERRAQCRDLGLWADCRRPCAPLDAAGGAEHRAAGVAPRGFGDASRPAHGTRAPGGTHG